MAVDGVNRQSGSVDTTSQIEKINAETGANQIRLAKSNQQLALDSAYAATIETAGKGVLDRGKASGGMV
jgi:hypothetical protein